LSLTTDTKNDMLDAVHISTCSLHTGFPGTAGTNEVSGGAYERQSITLAAASDGEKDASDQPLFDVPESTTVKWAGFFDSSSVLRGYGPLGGTQFVFSTDVSADTISAIDHGLADGDVVVFGGDTPPGGLDEGTEYYVIGASENSFQVAATAGGSAIDLTSAAGEGATASKLVAETFNGAGTYLLRSFSIVQLY
jgi:hypothetical protein